MATSKVAIANMALTRLGADTIVSFTDGTKAAQVINLIYDQMVDEVLIESPWSAATFRIPLAQLPQEPAVGFKYQYQLPTNPFCLKVLDLYEPAQYEEQVNLTTFKIEGTKLLTDQNSAIIKYTGRLTDPATYGPFITKVLISRLTLELAYLLTGKEGMVNQLRASYEDDLSGCMAADGQQGSSDRTSSVALKVVR